MADHVKQTKNKVWELKRSIQQEEAQRDDWAEMVSSPYCWGRRI